MTPFLNALPLELGGLGSVLLVDCLSCHTVDRESDSGLTEPGFALDGLFKLACDLGELLGVVLPPAAELFGNSGLSLEVSMSVDKTAPESSSESGFDLSLCF
jgi:hypothetical protein